jgi:predicted transcriptional regulator
MSTVNPIELTAEIVTAFVSNNFVPPGELSALIQTVHAAVTRLADGGESSAPAPVEAQAPAVSIRKSVTPDYLICLDDGKRFKSLRRHLTALELTPHQYREKWKLPADYPMVAANYAAQRSQLAKKIGLGRKKAVALPPALASQRKTGRRRKAAVNRPLPDPESRRLSESLTLS